MYIALGFIKQVLWTAQTHVCYEALRHSFIEQTAPRQP